MAIVVASASHRRARIMDARRFFLILSTKICRFRVISVPFTLHVFTFHPLTLIWKNESQNVR